MSSLFSAFEAPNTAGPQIQGLQSGYSLALPALQQGSQDLTQYYSAALAPYTQNYAQAQQGVGALGNALGLGGPRGNAAATQSFWNNPAISAQLNQGSQNVLRNQAATGQLSSGATQTALQNQGQQTAAQGWQNYVNSLQPYLGASNAAASGIAGVDTGLGSALNANQGNIAGLGWAEQTGIGNAQANQAIENQQAAAAPWNLLLGLGGMKTAGGGTVGGSALTGLGGLLFSDVWLKEDVQKVGELHDGQNVYAYRYKGDETPRIGLIAQEVERTNPDAVKTHPSGYKMVDYDLATKLSRFLEAA